MNNNSVQDAFKHNKARRHIIVGGMVIMFAITILSAVSSFVIYRDGFKDVPHPFDKALAFFAVLIVEGAFIWLVYGFTRAFSSTMERLISVLGIIFLFGVMLVNLVTHFMMVKNIQINDFQRSWTEWGAVMVFMGVLLIVLFITLADPVIKLIRLELRYLGKQEETILDAKMEGLEGQEIIEAMRQRGRRESRELADRIIGESRQLPAGSYASAPRQAGMHRGRVVESDDVNPS